MYHHYFLNALFMTRWRIAFVYVGTAVFGLVLTALISFDLEDLLQSSAYIIWFPHGIAILFSVGASTGGPCWPLYWGTVAFYACASVLGTIFKARRVYLVFVLVFGLNIGGCSKMWAIHQNRKDEKKVRLALRHEEYLKNRTPEQHLHDAVGEENIVEVKLLLAQGTRVTEKNLNGYSPLHIAIIRKNTKIVELLLDHGATVATDPYALRSAVTHTRSPDIAQLLVGHGWSHAARPENGGKTVLEYALSLEDGKVSDSVIQFLRSLADDSGKEETGD